MLNFITGPWGELIGKGLLILSVITCIWIAVVQHDTKIARDQQARDQMVQLQRAEKERHDLDVKLNNLAGQNTEILAQLAKKNNKVIETHEKVTTYLQSPEAQKSNRDTSDVIKNTIGMLRNDQ